MRVAEPATHHGKVIEIVLVSALFVCVSLVSALVQRPTAVNQGRGWDGNFYYSAGEQLLSGKKPRGEGPFVYRLGTPFLAGLMGKEDLLRGFKAANILGAVIVTALMIVWLRIHIQNWKIRLILLALFVTQWHAPVRFVYFYPTNSDPWALAFCVAGLICAARLSASYSPGLVAALCAICFVGTLFRETVVLVALAAVFALNPIRYREKPAIRRPPLMTLLPLACWFAGTVVAHSLATKTGNYSFLGAAAFWGYTQSLAMYVHAWLIAFGPVLILLVFGWREVGHFLWNHQYQLAYCAGAAGLGWIGGADTERFAFWSMPVVYVLCGKVMERKAPALKAPLLIAFLAVTQAISQRLFWTVPDEWESKAHPLVILTPIGTNTAYLDLYSHYGSVGVRVFSMAEYCLVGLILLAWLYYRQRRQAKATERLTC